MTLKLTFGCALYDAMAPLLAKRAVPDGIDLEFLVEEDHRSTFDRMGGALAFDLAEMSGTELVTRHAAGGSPLIALPVFTSRVFRHSFCFINRRARIRAPKDLEGKRIGVPLYTMSAALWLRGMLTDEFGVDFGTVRWLQGAVESAGTHGTPTLPPGIIRVANLEQNASGTPLWELLVAGEIDALMTPGIPHKFGTTDVVGRLFEDYKAEEERYYRKTGIFPIMHMVALRRDRYEAHPFIARSLFDAFEHSKALAREALYEPGAPRTMLPFLPAYLDETRRVFDGDPWVYGVEPNRRTLEAQQRYLHREGLIAERFPIEELFAPV